MDKRSSNPIERGKHAAPTPSGQRRRPVRTLGPCAHCGEPVAVDCEHVRLYRLAWHAECALVADEHRARG